VTDSRPSYYPTTPRAFLDPRRAIGRFTIAIAFGTLVACVLPAPTWSLRGLVGWDAGAAFLLAFIWLGMAHADADATRARCAAQDPGRTAVFGIALVSSLFSLFAAIYVFRHARQLAGYQPSVWSTLALVGVALSWVLTHTSFTLRYAHLYYRSGLADGLDFPGDEAPSDIDFAYFAFTIGMCFQVSDVVIACSRIRREALIHALLSFVYNTVILALTMNLLFTMLSA
jgi:uncharacterized membrane protein